MAKKTKKTCNYYIDYYNYYRRKIQVKIKMQFKSCWHGEVVAQYAPPVSYMAHLRLMTPPRHTLELAGGAHIPPPQCLAFGFMERPLHTYLFHVLWGVCLSPTVPPTVVDRANAALRGGGRVYHEKGGIERRGLSMTSGCPQQGGQWNHEGASIRL